MTEMNKAIEEQSYLDSMNQPAGLYGNSVMSVIALEKNADVALLLKVKLVEPEGETPATI